jgi:hypothetical protein
VLPVPTADHLPTIKIDQNISFAILLIFASLTSATTSLNRWDVRDDIALMSARVSNIPHLITRQNSGGIDGGFENTCIEFKATCQGCFGPGYVQCPDGVHCYYPND